jgi:hypothetical protein
MEKFMKKLSLTAALLLPLFAFASEVIAPVELKLQALSGEAVKIEWKNGDDSIFNGPKGYKIYRDGEFLTATRASCYTGGTTNEICAYTDHNLKPNTAYTYTIVATDDETIADDSKYISNKHEDVNYFALSADGTKAYGKYIIGGQNWDDEVNTFIKITDLSNPDTPVDTGLSYQIQPYIHKEGDKKGLISKGTVRSTTLSKDGSKIFLIVRHGLEDYTYSSLHYDEDAYYVNFLTILDADDLSVISRTELHEELEIINPSSDGKKLYVTSKAYNPAGSRSKKIIDISDVSNPRLTETIDYPKLLIASNSNKLYGVEKHVKFVVIDENSKAELGSFPIKNYYGNLILSSDGTTVYALGSTQGSSDGFLKLIDVRDSNNPRVISTIDTPSHAEDVAISKDGKKAYIAHGDGVEIVDISNPYNPKVVHNIYIDYGVDKVSLVDDKKLIASKSKKELFVVDISSF